MTKRHAFLGYDLKPHPAGAIEFDCSTTKDTKSTKASNHP
jgi:hypothetical protein